MSLTSFHKMLGRNVLQKSFIHFEKDKKFKFVQRY